MAAKIATRAKHSGIFRFRSSIYLLFFFAFIHYITYLLDLASRPAGAQVFCQICSTNRLRRLGVRKEELRAHSLRMPRTGNFALVSNFAQINVCSRGTQPCILGWVKFGVLCISPHLKPPLIWIPNSVANPNPIQIWSRFRQLIESILQHALITKWQPKVCLPK